ncbi:hypothetical protein TWF694_005594 [Orbilia ellipsospora]|uniref:Uncharacterized protein n=1 Tax=Orbilia ellipsospora TaxID=2528407 RepID=A0AAV9WZL0_9PEZI
MLDPLFTSTLLLSLAATEFIYHTAILPLVNPQAYTRLLKEWEECKRERDMKVTEKNILEANKEMYGELGFLMVELKVDEKFEMEEAEAEARDVADPDVEVWYDILD